MNAPLTTDSRRIRRARQFVLSRGIEQRTFRQAAFASAGEGLTQGLMSLNAYVAIKSMGALDAGYEREVATLITMLPSVAMVFATAYDTGPAVRGKLQERKRTKKR